MEPGQPGAGLRGESALDVALLGPAEDPAPDAGREPAAADRTAEPAAAGPAAAEAAEPAPPEPAPPEPGVTASADVAEVVVTIPTLAAVDAAGRYAESAAGVTQTLRFRLVSVGSDWRIAELEDGVALPAADFDLLFRRASLYFPDAATARRSSRTCAGCPPARRG